MGSHCYQNINPILCFVFVQICFLSLLSQCATPPKRKPYKTNVTHSLRITKFQCIDAPYKLTHLNYCQMEQLQNGTVGLNVSVSIPIVLNYIEVSAKLFYKYTTYRPFMIDWSIEFCQTYRAGKFNPSAALILKVVEETLPLYYYSCPHGNRTYSALWLFGSQFIPEALPSGNYRMDIRLRDSTNTVLIASRIYGAVRKQGLIG